MIILGWIQNAITGTKAVVFRVVSLELHVIPDKSQISSFVGSQQSNLVTYGDGVLTVVSLIHSHQSLDKWIKMK